MPLNIVHHYCRVSEVTTVLCCTVYSDTGDNLGGFLLLVDYNSSEHSNWQAWLKGGW